MAEQLTLSQIAHLLNQTLSHDITTVRDATDSLDRFSLTPLFPFYLLSISTEGENQGQKVAAATYLKNLTRRTIDKADTPSNVSKEFKEQLLQALLRAEFPILKILVEVFRSIVVAEFVKRDLWLELVPNLQSAIQNSNLIKGSNSTWNTIDALIVLHALVRPFQYFLNPKVAKEPVPPQLELIAKEILAPLLAVFHHFVVNALATHDRADIEAEKVLLTSCKCLYFAVRSYMPSALVPLLPSFCRDLISILGSLSFDGAVSQEDGYLTRLKIGKRSLLIFSALVTRHRKHSDKLMPEIVNCILKMVKFSKNTNKLPFLSERVLSLGFDVISNVLETGPGWRLVSPHFTTLLESAIFPALVMNEKDVSEWEEDTDEYIRKNLPSDIDEISGWREDLFTARKSATNLLGVISMSKGPPTEAAATDFLSASSKRKKGQKNKNSKQRRSMGELLVLPFLSKFPIPSSSNAYEKKILNDYFGVLMAYGGLQDFLREQEPDYVTSLIRTRILPLYTVAASLPYLVASANWVLGELGSCLPEDMSADVYSQLLMALVMPDQQDTSCYPVRVSAAGAITTLLDNDYMPPDFLPLLQVIVGNIGNDESESSILFQLISSIVESGDEKVAVHVPHIVSSLLAPVSKWLTPDLEPWPQVVERAIAALAVMGQTWEDSRPEESKLNESQEKWDVGQLAIGRTFASLLQQAWLTPICSLDQQDQQSPPSSCIEDLSTLLRSVMLSINGSHMIEELKLSELLSVWAEMIAEWHAWEESEDLSIFDVIKEVVTLDSKFRLKNFIVKEMPSPPAPPVPHRSVIEGISTFVSEAIKQYPSATLRACSCVHILLHCPTYSLETEGVKESLAIAFSRAAFSRFIEVRSTPDSLWKPLLLGISSCYLCYPDIVEGILEKGCEGGVTIWASALCHVSSSSFEPSLTEEPEMKLIVMTLARFIEQLLRQGKSVDDSLRNCFTSLLEVSVRLKEMQDGKEDDDDENDDEEEEDEEDSDNDDSEDYDEESEAEEYEETEEAFLDRYAKAAEENASIIEEGDVDDQELEIELGQLNDVDEQKVVLSLIDKYHNVLIRGQALPSHLMVNFLNAFPDYGSFFL
ncbi:PREDICTED: importin beta-like SAD2 homolog isoform X1 [Lupinus angustifolius]|uniref:importin beta-like SAD2 homolog isoform X1 n=1 Tax=Lupinus angustifolius TaxID=3871 RepID=UPI00092E75E9|nr:PREDICTED: importin beta-like SAD2 homolog isoform X1 [Lupinus angustifolius]XP_019464241.1 PREDICTED: importin beta-like SAD2 homolog isoform X1 [Lupinus angustifolius]